MSNFSVIKMFTVTFMVFKNNFTRTKNTLCILPNNSYTWTIFTNLIINVDGLTLYTNILKSPPSPYLSNILIIIIYYF